MRRVRFSPFRFIRWLLIMLLIWTSIAYVRSNILPQFLLYEQVRFERVEVTVAVKPIVLQEENILVAPIKGTMIPLAEEGKVDRSIGIFEVKNVDSMEKITQDLKEVDRLIANFEQESSRLLKVKESRLVALEREYSESVMIAKESALLYGLDSKEYKETFKDMQSLESEWLGLDAEVAGIRQERDTLLERREYLRKLTLQSNVVVESRDDGYLSYQLDGLETKLSPARFDTLSLDIFEALNGVSTYQVQGEVEAGEPVAKIVRDDSQLLAMLVAENLFNIGQSVTMYHQGITHKLNVIGQKEIQGDHLLLLKPVEPWVEPGVRFFSAELVVESRQGLLVPQKAIFEKEGITGVYVKEDMVEWRPIEVLVATSAGVMVHGVTQGEWVVSNPRLLRYLQ